MKVNREKLIKALNIVKPGLSSKEVMEQTTSFAFVEGRVVTYNDDISISHPVEDGLKELQGAIHAEELYKFISKVKTEEIDMDVQADQIVLKSGRSKVGFTLKTDIILPLRKLPKKAKWEKLPEKLKYALEFVSHTCSRDMTAPILTCVHVHEKGFVEGTDGFRLAHFNLGKKLPIGTILIPAQSAIEAGKLDTYEVCQDKSWVHFRTKDKTVFSTRILDEPFVNTESMLTVPKKGIKLKFPEALKEVLDKAQIFANRKSDIDESVEVRLTKNKLVIFSESETAWFKEALDLDYKKGKPFTFKITPYLLRDILKETLECTLFKDRLFFKSDTWQYVTALRWTEETEK